ncbi:hypothetical protein STVIR_7861 [Streptomyces viridochromogenes Tue57]|uniref:Uncharacterized protein n=1 Tax=Streptomyces viridochromogenes Tue57 TaxID=1160705 RepID=L8P0V7_STRVR|nr:hypothetical protein STVIR_7861 [Streptomyces viridochromogenes Tue57]
MSEETEIRMFEDYPDRPDGPSARAGKAVAVVRAR